MCVSARSGWRDYALRSLSKLKAQTGIDGFWLDSHWNFGLEPVNYAEAAPTPQFGDFLKMQAKLERMGSFILVESRQCPFGVPAHGPPVPFSELGLVPGVAHACYKTSPMVCATAKAHQTLTKIGYFRLLAFKATPIMFFHKALREDTPFRAEVVYANRAYAAVHELMDRAHRLPEDKGVEWVDRESGKRVLWAFDHMNAKLGAEGAIVEAVSGKVVAQGRGTVKLDARKVYVASDRVALGP